MNFIQHFNNQQETPSDNSSTAESMNTEAIIVKASKWHKIYSNPYSCSH